MKKDNEFQQIEALLSGKIAQPSPRFEEALGKIPGEQAISLPNRDWIGFLKVAGIAAAVSIIAWSGLDFKMNDQVPSAERILAQDSDLLTLFSLANDLDMAGPLLSEDNLLALDYLTSTP